MIITKTPFRMSFFGGGTDIPDFFNKKRGAVISSTFDKYVYLTIRKLPPFFDYKNEIIYSIIERENSIDDISHPLVKNAMIIDELDCLRITYDADLPARSGLGTSSSFAVGLLNAFSLLKNLNLDKNQLAKKAIYLEREVCKEEGGWQDQIAAAFGGINRIDFENGNFVVTPIKISDERKEKLNDNLMLFFTGFTRLSHEIQKKTKNSITEKKETFEKLLMLVDEAQEILENENIDLDRFGMLLDQTWKLKRKTGDHISNTKIDEYYERGKNAGALGGKLLGAGGGGFILFYVPNKCKENVRKEFNDLLEIKFSFEDNGTQIIFNE